MQTKINHMTCIFKLGNCFWLQLQLVIRPQLRLGEFEPLILGDEVMAIWFAETQNLKR